MGCDIHIIAQRCDAGEWRDVTGNFAEGPNPFNWRAYGMFGFFGQQGRNYSEVPPISEYRGLPEDFDRDPQDDPWLGDYGYSWLSVAELAAFDYDKKFEDRRVTRQLAPNHWSGGCTAEPGEGRMTTFREFLGPQFFRDLDELQRICADRIVFGFDS